MGRAALLALTLLLLPGAASAQPASMTVIDLRWAEARAVAAMFADEPPPAEEELRAYRQQWVDDFAADVAGQVRRRPDSRWHYASSMIAAPREQLEDTAGALWRMLPAGLDGPPVALPNRNALLVSGDPVAIDQLRELISLVDVKPRMVNIEVRLLDEPVTSTDEWGIDIGRRFGDLTIGSLGNAPARGGQVRWERDGTQVTGGWNQGQTRSETLTAANITTTDNVPAVLTTGRLLPYVTSRTYYGPWRNRVTETVVDAVFIGSELFVQPRINGDDTVTMTLRPTFIDAVGTLAGPHGVQLPITQSVGVATQVTVRDGETMQIGGFERSLAEYNTRFRGLLGERRVRIDSHPRMYVTPRIIRDLDGGRR